MTSRVPREPAKVHGRTDPSSEAGPGPIVLFDGVCNLCSLAVQWVIERDPGARFRFASLQSSAARRELERFLEPNQVDALPDSIVLLDSDGVHTRSDAALRIARGLRAPFPVLALGSVLPRVVRDSVYDLVARNRYRWFGRRDTCMRPTPELAHRFLDRDEPVPPPLRRSDI